MSGLSLAVGPRTDPTKDEVIAAPPSSTKYKAAMAQPQNQQQAVVGGVMGSLRVIELQLVAFIMVFSASGLVPLIDLIFPAFASAYLLLLSRLAFPSHGNDNTGTLSGSSSREIFEGSKLMMFRLYVMVGTTIGMFLPLAYVLGGFARGDDHALRCATPSLFLLSFQILTENIISGFSLFSPPIRALVPLLYTVRRIFVITDWIQDVWVNKTLPVNAQMTDVAWYWFGKCLAVANLVYFSINLFGFLLPRFLPRSFEMYFRQRDEIHSKLSEDKARTASAKTSSAANNQTKKGD
ncbi:hypothetical protein MKW98_004137 [Papaver atlanticum]|uniref:DUF7733 domain-containing protein n=1 Tax=Papaver atlanticum TaxID=357466 RepID=A0AAD4T181_9MAGN|nr:hypothetical protein MKW98_004137 [Papaver atlanticum]